MMTTPRPNGALPVGRLVRHAYLDTLANLPALVRIGGLWLLLAWALLLLARGGLPLAGVAGDLVVTLGAAAMAVMWHRHILLGEPLAAWMAPVTTRVGRFFVLSVALALLPLVGVLLTGALAFGQPGGAGLLLAPVLLLGALYLALRLQLVLPGVAIDDRALTPARSWQLTRGNGWRLLLGFVAVTVPVAAVAVLLAVMLDYGTGETGSVLLGALVDLAVIANAWFQVPLLASFLSYAYAFFTGPPPTAPADGAVPAVAVTPAP
jgi:hypothetical protein